jgi:hypothetical protein
LADAEARVAELGSALGRPLHLLAETTSTNDEAKHAAKQGGVPSSTLGAPGRSLAAPARNPPVGALRSRVSALPHESEQVALEPHVTTQLPLHFISQVAVSLHVTVLPAPKFSLQSADAEQVPSPSYAMSPATD